MSHRFDPWKPKYDRANKKGIYLNSTRRTMFTKQLPATRAERKKLIEGGVTKCDHS